MKELSPSTHKVNSASETHEPSSRKDPGTKGRMSTDKPSTGSSPNEDLASRMRRFTRLPVKPIWLEEEDPNQTLDQLYDSPEDKNI